jgi:hypothetical protein
MLAKCHLVGGTYLYFCDVCMVGSMGEKIYKTMIFTRSYQYPYAVVTSATWSTEKVIAGEISKKSYSQKLASVDVQFSFSV